MSAVGTFADASYEDFEQIERIGSGGNADVYKARYREDSTVVALKVPRISDEETVDTSTFSEFVNEAEVWSGIDAHGRIVSVYAWGDQPLPWIAVEYMDEGTLGAQSLGTDQVYAELEGFCEALHHAHRQGVTHTDIKPENILYKKVNGDPFGKFTDWGLANELLEHSTSVAGFTPDYSAPEQLEPEEYGGTDEQTDIYQLGVVAYELFTGELPYEGGSSQGASVMAVLNDEPKKPSEINPGLDEGLDDVLLKVLSKEKENRYETALHFRDDLRRAYDQNRR
jgi:serine/threonine protein kinase